MVRELAYAKLNLVLHVGPRRDDGMHPVCSLVASIDLADEVVAEPKESGEDSVECQGVPGHNLAARALAEFRSRAGSELPPLAITITKRVPGIELAGDVGAEVGGDPDQLLVGQRPARELVGDPQRGGRVGASAAEAGGHGHALRDRDGERRQVPPGT